MVARQVVTPWTAIFMAIVAILSSLIKPFRLKYLFIENEYVSCNLWFMKFEVLKSSTSLDLGSPALAQLTALVTKVTLSCVLQVAWPMAVVYATCFVVCLKLCRLGLLKRCWGGCPKSGPVMVIGGRKGWEFSPCMRGCFFSSRRIKVGCRKKKDFSRVVWSWYCFILW